MPKVFLFGGERDGGLRPSPLSHARNTFLRVASLHRTLRSLSLTLTGFEFTIINKLNMPSTGLSIFSLAEREGFEPSQGLSPL